MQTLSTWPSINEYWLLPQLVTELDPCFNSCQRRERSERLCLSGPIFHLHSEFHRKRSKNRLRFKLDELSHVNHLVKEHSVSLNGVPGECERSLLSGDQLEEVSCKSLSFKGTDKENNDKEQEQRTISEGLLGIGRNGKVDVRKLGLSLHLARTADDVEEILKNYGQLPIQVYSSLIRGLGKDQKIDSAMALFEWLKKRSRENDGAICLNLFIFNSLLGAAKQAERYDDVGNIMKEMSSTGLQPNVVTYNTLMAIHIEQGREAEALNLFEEISRRGLFPSPASYSTALLAYRKLGDGFGALKFFVEVKDKYEKGEMETCKNEDWDNEIAKLENYTTRMCFEVIRNWLVSCKDLRTDILRLLMEMDKAGLRPGRADYERLVWACTDEEHYIVAKELYTRIRERDSDISLSVCNHVIWLMGKAKKWWAALEIYEDLLDRGPKPNNMSYELIVSHFNILLTSARRRGIWRWGLRLLDKMEEKGLKPGSKEWNAVLIACSKASEPSAAVEIFKRMVENGERPTIISYGALLSALEKGKLYDEALQVWKHMTKVGVPPNLYAYTIMASVYTAQGQFNIVNSIIKEMVTTGVEPTVVTFNAIISTCARNDMGSEAYEWFHRMKDHNITPNEVTYEMLIEALSRGGKPRLVYELYIRAINEGLTLSSKAYDQVIHCSQIYGASIDKSSLGHRPAEREKKKKPHLKKNLPELSSLADAPTQTKPLDKNEIHCTYRDQSLADVIKLHS